MKQQKENRPWKTELTIEPPIISLSLSTNFAMLSIMSHTPNNKNQTGNTNKNCSNNNSNNVSNINNYDSNESIIIWIWIIIQIIL